MEARRRYETESVNLCCGAHTHTHTDAIERRDSGDTTILKGPTLTWRDILPVGEAEGVSDDAFAREQMVGSLSSIFGDARPRRESHRSDSVRVPERNKSKASNHGRASVGARTLSHEVSDGGEDVLLVDSDLARLLKVVGEDVEEQLRVRVGVDVSVGFGIKEGPQLLGVGKVTVL